MRIQEILDLAMTLKPVERLLIIDGLLRSLDEPDHNIDELCEYSGESVPLIPGESVPVIPGEYVPPIPEQSVPPFSCQIWC